MTSNGQPSQLLTRFYEFLELKITDPNKLKIMKLNMRHEIACFIVQFAKKEGLDIDYNEWPEIKHLEPLRRTA